MKTILQSILSVFFSIQVFANNFNGTISRSTDHIFFNDNASQKKYILTSASIETQNQLEKLNTSDFISFDGTLLPDDYLSISFPPTFLPKKDITSTVVVNSINYVGLSIILGGWKGDDKYCYRFINFTEMSVSLRDNDICNFNHPTSIKYLSYTINPASQNWFALISDDTSSYGADLTIKTARFIELNLYDSNSGSILKKIKLKK